jgi:hypothetical protein
MFKQTMASVIALLAADKHQQAWKGDLTNTRGVGPCPQLMAEMPHNINAAAFRSYTAQLTIIGCCKAISNSHENRLISDIVFHWLAVFACSKHGTCQTHCCQQDLLQLCSCAAQM